MLYYNHFIWLPYTCLSTHAQNNCCANERKIELVRVLPSAANQSPIGKKSASPAAHSSRPQPSLIVRAICVRHPRSTRSRLAPLHYASKKITPLSLRFFLLAPFRLKAVLPALFFSPLTKPRPPTP